MVLQHDMSAVIQSTVIGDFDCLGLLHRSIGTLQFCNGRTIVAKDHIPTVLGQYLPARRTALRVL